MDYVKRFPLKTFKRSELLIQKGDRPEYVLAIREGFVKVTSISDTGVERLLWIAGRYDTAPTEQLFSHAPNVRYFYTALTDGSYYEVNKKDFLEKAASTPSLMAEIAKSMSTHYDALLEHIDAVDTATVKERLLRTLSYLAERLSGNTTVDLYTEGLHLTHSDFAALIGSTRETTSLILNEIRQQKLIDYSRKKFIVHVETIQKYLEEM